MPWEPWGYSDAQRGPTRWGPTPVRVQNTGRTIQVNPQPGYGIILDGVRSELEQLHFHHRSEHLIDGVRMPLDMHLVPRSGDGSVVVVGVFFAEGGKNETLAQVGSTFRPSLGRRRTRSLARSTSQGCCRSTVSRGATRALSRPLPAPKASPWVVLAEPLTM